jgi:hypothetical protein
MRTCTLLTITGLITFNGIIIKNLGFSSVESSLLAMPTGVMSTLASILFSLLAAKWNNRRCLVCMMACVVPIAGTAILYGVPRSAVSAQLVGLYFVSVSKSLFKIFQLIMRTVLYLFWTLCRRNISCSSEHSWSHQEERPIRSLIHWLCCRQPDWPTNISSKPGACIYWWSSSHAGVLLRMYRTDGCLLGSLCLPESWSCCAANRSW